MKKHQQHQQLNEGLRSGDLEHFVDELFTVDRYSSKMGEDKDIVVIGFNVREKHPAMDLVEFLETGYKYILDADMSSGEEASGNYQVFVEMERTKDLPAQLKELLSGVSQLTKIREWRFRYQKSPKSVEFTEESVMENIPTTPAEYESKIVEIKEGDIKEFFDQGSVDIALEADNTLTFSKPYSGDVTTKFIAIGEYDDVKETLPGKLSLDENSQSQMFFLTKYLGNYDINKIGDKFLIRNGNKAVVLEKGRW